MINIVKYSQEAGVKYISADELHHWDFDCEENLWIDMYDASESESEKILKDSFSFHPLAIEDALKYLSADGVHHPKIDDFDKYLFIVFNGLTEGTKAFEYKIYSLSCFLGRNFLITIHNESPKNTITNNLNAILNERSFRKGPDYILNLILDEIVDRYYPILESLESEIDEVEVDLFQGYPGTQTLQRILNLKKELIKLRRISSYQKEVLFKLTRGDSELVSTEESLYYRNVYDHLVRVSDTSESYRDYVAGMLDSYLSIVNNRMNEIMKFLTIISTIMLPLTLISGIFGMNFEFIPFLHDELGFRGTMITMLIVALIMLSWFRHKKWI